MKRNLFFLIIFSGSVAFSQNFDINRYMPLNIKKAVENSTRSYDGKPGAKYVQNELSYKITAELHPTEGKVTGSEEIIFKNNFDATLEDLVFRLYQDSFKKGVMRDFQIDPADLHDGTIITNLKINGVPINPEGDKVMRYGTTMSVKLDEPIPSGGSVAVSVSWEVQLPKINRVRMGKYNDSTFFVAYWYPQISVYDDLQGWDMSSYTMNHEFYNNFADFDVTITVPEGYLVWATGELQNPGEVYSDELLKLYNKAKGSEEVVHIISKEKKNELKTQKGKNRFHYTAKYVPDFAFTSAVDYLWDASVMTVDAKTGRKTFISAVYNENSKDFYDVAEIARKAIKYLSEDLPGVPYPYPAMTVFNGQGGMEFPMMVNDGSTESYTSAVGLTSHEIAHTWFPFFMGTNEVKYAHMDEGWAVMLPFKFQKEAGNYNPVARTIAVYEALAGREYEVPPMVPSNQLRGQTYRMTAYNRPATAYYLLQGYLGEEKFREAMRYYISEWNGKHPMPFDFFNSMSTFAGEDLSWFFKPWFFDWAYPDLSFEVSGGGEYTVTNNGRMPVPVKIYEVKGDERKLVHSQPVSVWKDGATSLKVKLPKPAEGAHFELGDKETPDANRSDNVIK